jgi:hypothetical protein
MLLGPTHPSCNHPRRSARDERQREITRIDAAEVRMLEVHLHVSVAGGIVGQPEAAVAGPAQLSPQVAARR